MAFPELASASPQSAEQRKKSIAKLLKMMVAIAVGVALYFTPAPKGLATETWQLFAIYIAAMVALVLRPFSEAVIFTSAVSLSAILFRNTSAVLHGYMEGVPWLIFSACIIGAAFIKTGLGMRIAYLLIGRLGRTTLGLGYVVVITDLLLSLVTPSNTARTGGIVLPIIRSISTTLGSEPGPTSRKVGGYLVLLAYPVSQTTSYAFVTACAPNLLIAKFAADILHVNLHWGNWFAAAVVPAFTMLLILPVLVYRMYPPEIKQLDHKQLSAEGLRRLGPMSGREKILLMLFILAVLGWTTGNITHIETTAVALAVLSLIMLTGILTWEEVAQQHQAWHMLIWFGGILGIMSSLERGKFFIWVTGVMREHLNFSGHNWVLILIILTIVSILIRYVFATGSAFVATMMPLFYTVGAVAGVPVFPLALILAFAHCHGALVAHYCGGCGVVLFGTGFVPQKVFWGVGAAICAVSTVVMFIAMPLWKVFGLW